MVYMASDTSDTTAKGNTKPSRSRARGRRWVFTLNNYTKEDIDTFDQRFLGAKYIFGKEVGESGTPHLQGYVNFPNAVSLESLRKRLPRAHFEIARGSEIENINYCSKDSNVVTNMEKPPASLEDQYNEHMHAIYDNVVWRPWQQYILNIIQGKPDPRSIYWIWEEEGNCGKSYLCRYIEWTRKTVLGNGKQADVFHGIKSYLDEKKQYPEILLVDIPRTAEDYVNYGVLEKVKDGLLYSGKYEGGVVRLLPMHVIVFANFPPSPGDLSKDRIKSTHCRSASATSIDVCLSIGTPEVESADC